MTAPSTSTAYFRATGRTSATKALADITEGVQRAPLWTALAWQEIKIRYRGSVLGPFWLSLSMGIMVIALGLLYGSLFKIPLHQYLPYLVTGLMTWSFISNSLGDGCLCFISAENFIKKVRLPYSIYVYRSVCRNLIIFVHNFIIYIIVAMIFGVWPGLTGLWLFPALGLLALNAVWISFLFGMVCARFRDVTQIINSLTQVVFFVTPIFWHPSSLSGRGYLVHFNPFYHLVELVREPLLGHDPTPENWLVGLAVTGAGMLFSFLFFRRFRARLAYWV